MRRHGQLRPRLGRVLLHARVHRRSVPGAARTHTPTGVVSAHTLICLANLAIRSSPCFSLYPLSPSPSFSLYPLSPSPSLFFSTCRARAPRRRATATGSAWTSPRWPRWPRSTATWPTTPTAPSRTTPSPGTPPRSEPFLILSLPHPQRPPHPRGPSPSHGPFLILSSAHITML